MATMTNTELLDRLYAIMNRWDRASAAERYILSVEREGIRAEFSRRGFN